MKSSTGFSRKRGQEKEISFVPPEKCMYNGLLYFPPSVSKDMAVLQKATLDDNRNPILVQTDKWMFIDEKKYHDQLYKEVNYQVDPVLLDVNSQFMMQSQFEALSNANPNRRDRKRKAPANAQDPNIFWLQTLWLEIQQDLRSRGLFKEEQPLSKKNNNLPGQQLAMRVLNEELKLYDPALTNLGTDMERWYTWTNLLKRPLPVRVSTKAFSKESKFYMNDSGVCREFVIEKPRPGLSNLPNEAYTFLIPAGSCFGIGTVNGIAQKSSIRNYFEHELMIADPPWMNKAVGRQKTYKTDYNTLDQVHDVTEMMKPDALFAIWATNAPIVHEQIVDIFAKWHIKEFAKWYWVKATDDGLPVYRWDRADHKRPYEMVYFGASPQGIAKWGKIIKNDYVMVSKPLLLPSRKPPLRAVIERLYKKPLFRTLELFARNLDERTTSIGHQVLLCQKEPFLTKRFIEGTSALSLAALNFTGPSTSSQSMSYPPGVEIPRARVASGKKCNTTGLFPQVTLEEEENTTATVAKPRIIKTTSPVFKVPLPPTNGVQRPNLQKKLQTANGNKEGPGVSRNYKKTSDDEVSEQSEAVLCSEVKENRQISVAADDADSVEDNLSRLIVEDVIDENNGSIRKLIDYWNKKDVLVEEPNVTLDSEKKKEPPVCGEDIRKDEKKNEIIIGAEIRDEDIPEPEQEVQKDGKIIPEEDKLASDADSVVEITKNEEGEIDTQLPEVSEEEDSEVEDSEGEQNPADRVPGVVVFADKDSSKDLGAKKPEKRSIDEDPEEHIQKKREREDTSDRTDDKTEEKPDEAESETPASANEKEAQREESESAKEESKEKEEEADEPMKEEEETRQEEQTTEEQQETPEDEEAADDAQYIEDGGSGASITSSMEGNPAASIRSMSDDGEPPLDAETPP